VLGLPSLLCAFWRRIERSFQICTRFFPGVSLTQISPRPIMFAMAVLGRQSLFPSFLAGLCVLQSPPFPALIRHPSVLYNRDRGKDCSSAVSPPLLENTLRREPPLNLSPLCGVGPVRPRGIASASVFLRGNIPLSLPLTARKPGALFFRPLAFSGPIITGGGTSVVPYSY